MKQQNYQNHRKYYTLHHFIFLPVMTGLMIWGFIKASKEETNRPVWLLFSILCFFILYLAVMLRQHYALGNQDRIVRLEFRLRYFELTGKSASAIEQQLTFLQIAALRFANDTEFIELLNRALTESLDADSIKKSIKDWQGDYMRV